MNPYDFTSAEQLLKICSKERMTIAQVVIARECHNKNVSEAEVRAKMQERLGIIRESIAFGLDVTKRSPSGLSGGDAKRLNEHMAGTKLVGDTVYRAITYSFAIMEANAASFRIVAFPTAGASALVPASLLAASESLKLDESKIIDAFFTAGAIGMIIAQNASLAGASGGCQAEVGSASAMAATALVELRSGTPQQAVAAASIALKGLLGLVCDPVAGLVECPCIKRNATGLANSFMAQEIVLAGVSSNIPFDEVVSAMKEIGQTMSDKHKETARGGVATCTTGLRIRKKVFGE